MAGRYDQAEMLVALWRLGADGDMMPTSHGILDRALESLKEHLPPVLSTLTFSATGVGLRSYELPDILLAAQEAMLTSEPNPTYLSTLVTIQENEAAEIALANGLNVNDATILGKALREKVNALKSQNAEALAAA